MRRLLAALALTFTLALAAPLPGVVAGASAQDTEGEDAAESRAATFEAASGAQREEVPGGMLLVSAYGAILVILLGYVVLIGFRQATTARELDRLKADLAASAKKAGARPAEER